MNFTIHPGVVLALRRLRFNEYEVAEAIRDGLLASPQPFENVMLVDMRISGTGVSYRPKLKEWVYRRPENYLTADFLRRASGMPIIYEHPDETVLDSKSFAHRVVGTMQLPYIKGDEVWGIARIYDIETARELLTEPMSTSPSVVFRDPAVNYEMELDSGDTLLVEGPPSYVDHLAICTKGVWDKGGDAMGIRIDSSIHERVATINDSLSRLSRRMAIFQITQSVDRLVRRMDAEFNEADHPRDKDGKFGSGGGGSSGGEKSKAPDAPFLSELGGAGHEKVLWDPGEGKYGGYAIYGVKDPEQIRTIAKKYGMKTQFYKENEAVWISRRGAKFDK